jgi:hypothetical protein
LSPEVTVGVTVASVPSDHLYAIEVTSFDASAVLSTISVQSPGHATAVPASARMMQTRRSPARRRLETVNDGVESDPASVAVAATTVGKAT